MKLRCTHNSIRIRIRKSELEELQEKGTIEESIAFTSRQKLTFILRVSKQKTSEIHAVFDDDKLFVFLPKTEAEKWLTTSLVGLERTKEVGEGEHLHILVEKDFPCKDRVEEDKADFFESLAIEQEKDKC